MLAFAPDVALGGGRATFLPQSAEGSRRKDDRDMIAAFRDAGYTYADTKQALTATEGKAPGKLLGLFNLGNMDGALDRFYLKGGTVGRFPDQPDLTEQVSAALRVLERNPAGFFLMVESGMIDKYNHPLDWERSVYDTIMLDHALKTVLDWVGDRNDTLVIVVPDHTHGVGIVGTVDDDVKAEQMRDKVGAYEHAGFPNYPPPDARGYPPSVDVSRRLALFYTAFPRLLRNLPPQLGRPPRPRRAQRTRRPLRRQQEVRRARRAAPHRQPAARRLKRRPHGGRRPAARDWARVGAAARLR